MNPIITSEDNDEVKGYKHTPPPTEAAIKKAMEMIIVNGIDHRVALRGMEYPINRQNLYKRLRNIKREYLQKNVERMVNVKRDHGQNRSASCVENKGYTSSMSPLTDHSYSSGKNASVLPSCNSAPECSTLSSSMCEEESDDDVIDSVAQFTPQKSWWDKELEKIMQDAEEQSKKIILMDDVAITRGKSKRR